MVGERTTLQVRRDLLSTLDAVKRELGVASYDEVIRVLLRERRTPKRSAFGRFPRLPSFRREELDRLD